MAWVAFDRAVKTRRAVRPRRARSSAGGRMRDAIHAEVCREGLRCASSARSCSRYGSKRARRQLADDPAGRLPAADRSPDSGTVAAIERSLMRDGFVAYPKHGVDGLPRARVVPAVHLLARRQLCALGRWARPASSSSACSRSATTLACCPKNTTRRQGCSATFRRRSSHVGLINTAMNLEAVRPAEHRKEH